MHNQFVRTQMLLSADAMAKLEQAHVIVFGIGGVGGAAVEALARAGVGHIDIVDDDVVSPSNINRQIIATTSSVGRGKVEVLAERVRDINPSCEVSSIPASTCRPRRIALTSQATTTWWTPWTR